ncbi:palmitoyltransferase ZDHHC12-A isoform X2 [Scleropages formosus]|nr:probable palmitoyltransferase ZDHHC12 isoform X2 [Scleropages formosus]XP_029115283.1 probable palmitoyltransferase ZDHHC12 isoform X2 [Scleropages formosus]
MLFLFLVLLSVLLYFVVSLSDPGFVRTDAEVEVTMGSCEELQEMIPHLSAALRQRRCGYCLLLQPMRAKHCQRCRRCVRRYDHHCPWMENCVGERNHRSFVFFLAVQLVVLVWGLQVAWSGFSATATWEAWLRHNGFLLAAFCVVGVFSVVVLLLLGSHLYLVSLNSTTWEFMSRHRISYLKQCGADENPFDRGTLRNLRAFFCSAHAVAWERLYTAGGTDPV